MHIQNSRGFTLVEMIVVLAIISIITVVAVTGQSTFNRSLLLTDTAYTVAFSIREVQTLGLSSRVFNAVTNAGYGIHFSSALPKSYIEFADTNTAKPGNRQTSGATDLCPGHTAVATSPESHPGNCVYEASYGSSPVQSEMVRTYTLNQGYSIKKFCGTRIDTGAIECSMTPVAIDTMNIIFMRPSTNTTIVGIRNGAITGYSSATITISSPDGATERCVTVSQVGQVGVAACS